jgi:hypothetical protein
LRVPPQSRQLRAGLTSASAARGHW